MAINKSLFTSNKDDWETPQKYFDEINSEFDFTIDVATSSDGKNSKLPNFYSIDDDALIQEWHGRVFCNPPYGRKINRWVEKAYLESQQDYCELIGLLIPSRTDTSYWHDFIFGKADEIRFIRGRLKFEVNGIGGENAPFPSALIIYKNKNYKER